MTRAAPRSIFAVALLASTFALGCSDRGTHKLAIEGSEQVVNGLTTADMWTVSFDQFVVVVHHPGLIERTDNEPTWVRQFGVTVWDVAQALDEGEELSDVIRATRYDGAVFQIAPASESGYEAVEGNVESGVLDAAVEDGWSIHVVGSATDTVTTVSFDWTFDTNTLYRCKFEGDEAVVLGADGDETTVIEILGEALFGDGFGAIAVADANGDGMLTQSELESAGVWEAIEGAASGSIGGVRGVGACPVVEE